MGRERARAGGGAEAILIDGTGAEATNNVWFGNLIQQNGYQYTATMLNAANNYGYANTGWDGNVVGPDSWRFTGTAGVSTGNICLGCMNMAALDSATGNVWLLLSANVFSGALSSDTVTSTVGNVVAKQNIVIGTGSQIVGNGNIGAKLYAPDASTWVMWNNNQNDFGLLKFGGTTSSFPALKRSTTGLLVRLADDSADAPISTSALNNTGASFTFNGHTCTIVSTVITCP